MAPAKVNLTLEVVGSRPDGYHELASVFATVDLRDRVRVAPWRALDVNIALVRMPTRLSTAAVFAAHRAGPYAAERSAKLAKALRDRKATVGVVRESLHNDLLAAAESVAPPIADARKRASALGIDLAMSGSGPSLFALGDDRAHAIRIARRLRRAGFRVRVVRLGVSP